VTGHLLDAARIRETVLTYREAVLADDRVIVGYTAAVTDDAGVPRGERECRAAVPLADLQRADPLPFDALHVVHLDGGAAARPGGRPLPFRVEVADGRHVALVLSPDTTGHGYVPLPSGALTRVRTARWAYPLLPLTLAIDAVGDPVLLFFTPAILVVGD
jgi:hypothetical protein